MIGMKFPGSLKPGESRTFYLMICAEDDESKLINVMKSLALDVEDYSQDKSDLFLSPVPADNCLTLSLSNDDRLEDVSIYNLLGVRVFELNEISENAGSFSVDVSKLVPGAYYLKAIINGSDKTGTFVIAR